jgi:hypothetical protein
MLALDRITQELRLLMQLVSVLGVTFVISGCMCLSGLDIVAGQPAVAKLMGQAWQLLTIGTQLNHQEV